MLLRLSATLCVLVPLFLPQASAASSISLGVVEATTLAGNSSDYGSQFTREVGFGGGVTAAYRFPISAFSLECDLLFLNRDFQENYQGASADINSKVFNIPLLLRWHFIQNLSFGLGIYFSQTIGSLTVDSGASQYTESYNGGPNKTPWQYDDSDGGWIAAVGTTWPMGGRASLSADMRYQRGGGFYTSSDFLLLVGLNLTFGAFEQDRGRSRD